MTGRRIGAAAVLALALAGASACSWVRGVPAAVAAPGEASASQRAVLQIAEEADRVAAGIEDLQALEIELYRAGVFGADGPAIHVAIQREFLAVAEALRPALADLRDIRADADRGAWLRFARKQIDRLVDSDALARVPAVIRGPLLAVIAGIQGSIGAGLALVGR